MGKFEQVLLVSDFDDTLTDDKGWVSEETQQALRYFIGQGGTFTVNTGRAVPAFRGRLCDVPVNGPVILSNGAIIYDYERETCLYTSLMDDAVRQDCARLARDNPDIGFEAYHGDDIYVHQPNRATFGHLNTVKLGYTQCPIGQMPLPWTKVILEQTHAYLEQVQQYIAENFKDRYEAVFSNPYLLEMTALGCNKGRAMLRLAELLQIPREHIYAAGDNMNDLSMLQAARMGFTPRGNGGKLERFGARPVSDQNHSPIRDVVEILDRLYR